MIMDIMLFEAVAVAGVVYIWSDRLQERLVSGLLLPSVLASASSTRVTRAKMEASF